MHCLTVFFFYIKRPLGVISVVGADGAAEECKYIWESFFKKCFSSAYNSKNNSKSSNCSKKTP